MKAKSSPERGRINRETSRKSGFTEERVTARTDQDRMEIEKMKQNQLARFISQRPEATKLSPSSREALIQTLLLKDSSEYVTPHGALSRYLTAQLENNLTAEVLPAVRLYSACFPTSLAYALKTIPAKVHNYLCRHTDATVVIKWTEENPDWKERITDSLQDGTFDDVLYQMRVECGAMKLNPQALKMFQKLKNDAKDISKETMDHAQDVLDIVPDALSLSPREWSQSSNRLRTYILFFLLTDLQQRYGEIEFPDRTFKIPIYDHTRELAGFSSTGVISFAEGSPEAHDYDYGLCVGWRYDQWEQCFYQLSLGAVFLLNPRLAPHGTLVRSTLEAGVAYRYAEEMREKYLPHITSRLVDSPVGTGSPHDRAYQLANKLPDDALRQVREIFGSFGTINDPARFADMTAQWLTQDEADILTSDFVY